MSSLLTKSETSPPSASLVTVTHDPHQDGVKEPDTDSASQTQDVGTATSFKSRLSLPMQKIASLQRFGSFGRGKNPEVQFPPASWGLDVDGSSESKSKSEPSTPAPPQEEPIERPHKSQPQTPADESNQAILEDVEPTYVARKIRALIDALPSVNYLNGSSASTGVDDSKRPPTPPGSMLDAKLKALLSSEAVMNGRGSQSVWSVLDSFRLGTKKPVDADNSKEEERLEDQEGVMLYAPLIPTPDSQIELAASEIVPDEAESENISDSDSKLAKGKGEEKAKAPKEQYVPSPTKISLQTTWYGYRLYLPPPVLAILDNQTIVTAKRAALLTTSLKWLLDKIPILMVPPPARPALMAVKRLTPYLGYVGTFIAWSWGSIKQHDEGYGVVLTATWILPVALIPSTWKPTEAQKAAADAAVAQSAPPASVDQTSIVSDDTQPVKTEKTSPKAKGGFMKYF